MKSARQQLLDCVERGDVIFGIAGGGQEKLMLVFRTTDASIFARHVTTQTVVEFSRDGRSLTVEGGGSCTIVSVAPLAPEEYGVVLGLDRKMRLAQAPDGFKLSADEIRLLQELNGYFKANLLPSD